MMKLFVLRHGDAETYAASDELRELTPLGRKNVAQTFATHKKDLQCINKLLVSPYVRAQQTAEIIRGLFTSDDNIQAVKFTSHTVDFITPDVHPQKAVDALYAIHKLNPTENILLVSHQPLVGYLIDMLCERTPQFMGRYPMSTASLACLEMDVLAAGCAELIFLHTP